jgi:hypothetical protein
MEAGKEIVQVIKDDNLTSVLTEMSEIGIDKVLDEGLLRDIPIVGTVVSLGKVGYNIYQRSYQKKLLGVRQNSLSANILIISDSLFD